MRYLFLAVPLLLSSCAASSPSQTVTVIPQAKTATQPSDSVIVVKGKRCKLVKPARPSSLAHPLPVENPKTLIDVLTDKLEEWVNYGNKVENLFKCKP